MNENILSYQLLHLEKSGEYLKPPLLIARGCGYHILFGYDSLTALLGIQDPIAFEQTLKAHRNRDLLRLPQPGQKPGLLEFVPFLDTSAMLALLILAERAGVISGAQHTDWQCFLDGFIEGDIWRAEREGKVSRDGIELWVRMPR